MAAGEDAVPAPVLSRPPVQKWGLLVTHLSAFREIPLEMTSDQMMAVVRLFYPYRDGPAQVTLEAGQITWRDRKGLRFSMASQGGVTELRVFVDKILLRRRRWTGWVAAACERLEMLARLVVVREIPTTGGRRSQLPPPETP